MKKDFKIERCITFYLKNGIDFIGDYSLSEKDFSLKNLKEIIRVEKDDDPLLYKQYEINENTSKAFFGKINFEFNFNHYDYFLETFSVDIGKVGKGIRSKEC